jgi:hypothetical protein
MTGLAIGSAIEASVAKRKLPQKGASRIALA